MNTDPVFWLAIVMTGLALGALWYACQDLAVAWLQKTEKDIAEKLRRLRSSTRNIRRYILGWMVAVVAVFLTFWLVLGSLIFGVLSAIFLLLTPWYLLRRMAERHRQKIEDQMADSMVALANAVRAGLSLAQSLEILASQCPKPINAEFHQIVAEYKLGKPLDRTLTEAKHRLKSENFALFAAALLAAHESGGRLNETVERIAKSVLEMQRLERKIKSETAQARKSAVYMALAPVVILVIYYFVDPRATANLFVTSIGQLLLSFAIVLNVIAYLWARVILNPDI